MKIRTVRPDYPPVGVMRKHSSGVEPLFMQEKRRIMRLIVGTDENGHSYAVRVDTFDRLKMFFVERLMDIDKELALEAAMAKSEDELMNIECPIYDAMVDAGHFQNRDDFVNLYDPMEKK